MKLIVFYFTGTTVFVGANQHALSARTSLAFMTLPAHGVTCGNQACMVLYVNAVERVVAEEKAVFRATKTRIKVVSSHLGQSNT